MCVKKILFFNGEKEVAELGFIREDSGLGLTIYKEFIDIEVSKNSTLKNVELFTKLCTGIINGKYNAIAINAHDWVSDLDCIISIGFEDNPGHMSVMVPYFNAYIGYDEFTQFALVWNTEGNNTTVGDVHKIPKKSKTKMLK